MKKAIKRKEIHDHMQSVTTEEEKRAAARDYVMDKLQINAEHKDGIMYHLTETFFTYYFKRLLALEENKSCKFEKRLNHWLSGDCVIPATFFMKKQVETKTPKATATTPISKRMGRPVKAFEDSSKRSQVRKIREITATQSLEILKHAVIQKFRDEGQMAASMLIKDCLSTPTRAKELLDRWKTPEKPHIQLSDMVSLELMQDAKLSKRQYIMVRDGTIKGRLGHYDKIQKLGHSLCCFESEKEKILGEQAAGTTTDTNEDTSMETMITTQQPVEDKFLNNIETIDLQ